jgi:AraC-like DNA-binding protein
MLMLRLRFGVPAQRRCCSTFNERRADWHVESRLLARRSHSIGERIIKLSSVATMHTMSEPANSTVRYLPSSGPGLLRDKAARLARVRNAWCSPIPNLKVAEVVVGSEGLALSGPTILLVCGGQARVAVGDYSAQLETGQALTVCLPLALDVKAEALADGSLVVMAIRLDMTIVAEMLLALKEPRRTIQDVTRNFALPSRNAQIVAAVSRLLDLFAEPREAEILGPGVLREVHFRALTGEHGDAVCSALGHNGRVAKIGRVLRRIHSEPSAPLSAEMLAEEACMCLTVFHENFRSVTGTTPLQYIKGVRLHAARVLMLRDGISAAAASSRVGYESPSQFGREFKRQFGKTPAQLARDEGKTDRIARRSPSSRAGRGIARPGAKLFTAAGHAPQCQLPDGDACAEHRANNEDRTSMPPVSARRDL